MFFGVRIPKRRSLVIANPTYEHEERIVEEEHMEANMGTKAIIKSKILFHFIKGKISLTIMETILIIIRELEYLEGSVKLARRKMDLKGQRNQIIVVHVTLAIRRVSINRVHHSETLHLVVEIN